ncbi:sensor histidine kinase [Kitasatospora mediocidica]|uniref:sensor histidine kinase n=1 Tax=Kitasatospora mediocidica TaxID=58352 RepID=UPI000690B1B3|nr:sensor histidine kinase [Kitasatospora mediocidica]
MSIEQTIQRLRPAVLPAVVVALVPLGWLDLVQHYALGAAPAMVLSVARVAPLLWCRSRPVFAWGVSLAAILLTSLVTRPVSAAEPWPWPVTSLAAEALVLVLAGSRVERRLSVAMVAAVLTATTVLLAALPGRGGWSNLLPVAVAVVLALVGAEVLRDRAQTRARLAEQERISETERTRSALLEERSRIGRELHDVVAHHMSLIAVRAETAPYRLPDTSAATREEFRAVSGAAREALTDMRRLLGLLRGDEAAERMPQPELAQLADLVRDAGPSVTLEVAGDLGSVPAAVGVCAYRIVQESLSNARRHANGASVAVRVERSMTHLLIVIQNGPGGAESAATRPSAAGPGHGLMGMRERAALLGGSFSAEGAPGRGFTVTADLPLPEGR